MNNGPSSSRTHPLLVGLSFCATVAAFAGCTVVQIPAPAVQPDLAAIVEVVNEAYRTQGFDRPVLFLDTGEACDSVLPNCDTPDSDLFPVLKSQLEADLQVKVRPFSEADFSDPFLPRWLSLAAHVGLSSASRS